MTENLAELVFSNYLNYHRDKKWSQIHNKNECPEIKSQLLNI